MKFKPKDFVIPGITGTATPYKELAKIANVKLEQIKKEWALELFKSSFTFSIGPVHYRAVTIDKIIKQDEKDS